MATCQEIEKNREKEEYLPLRIKESEIEGAGKGIFATRNLPSNRIVLSYLGKLVPHF